MALTTGRYWFPQPAAIVAQAAGIRVVMDRCILIEHARLFGNKVRVA